MSKNEIMIIKKAELKNGKLYLNDCVFVGDLPEMMCKIRISLESIYNMSKQGNKTIYVRRQ